MIRRVHLFELEDMNWFPSYLRNMITDFLYFFASFFKTYSSVVDDLEDAFRKSNVKTVQDCCSGRGGPISHLIDYFKARDIQNPKFLLSDKFPNSGAIAEIKANNVTGDLSYLEDDFDILADKPRHGEMTTLFTSLHHFRPNEVDNILRNHVEIKRPFAAFEFTERSFIGFLPIIFGPFMCLLITPLLRPFTLKRLIFTYLIPLIPLILFWDGLVSCLRTYSPKELKAIAGKYPQFDWKIGRNLEGGLVKTPITYIIGTPKDNN